MFLRSRTLLNGIPSSLNRIGFFFKITDGVPEKRRLDEVALIAQAVVQSTSFQGAWLNLGNACGFAQLRSLKDGSSLPLRLSQSTGSRPTSILRAAGRASDQNHRATELPPFVGVLVTGHMSPVVARRWSRAFLRAQAAWPRGVRHA